MTRYALAFSLFFSSLGASAQDVTLHKLSPEEETAALRSAEQMGAALFHHDRAGAVATDAALKVRAFKKDKRVRGWITEQREGQIVVTFIDQAPLALYRIAVSAEGHAGTVVALEPPEALSDFERGAAAARSAAVASSFEACSEKYNSVVLPADANGDWLVYLLPATTKKNIVPFGGTYRLTVSGSNILSKRAFTRSCIALDNNPKSVGLMITHILDPVPTEVHVFANLWAKKPLFVTIAPLRTLWSITDGQIKSAER